MRLGTRTRRRGSNSSRPGSPPAPPRPRRSRRSVGASVGAPAMAMASGWVTTSWASTSRTRPPTRRASNWKTKGWATSRPRRAPGTATSVERTPRKAPPKSDFAAREGLASLFRRGYNERRFRKRFEILAPSAGGGRPHAASGGRHEAVLDGCARGFGRDGNGVHGPGPGGHSGGGPGRLQEADHHRLQRRHGRG